MGHETIPIVKVIAAFITLLAELNDALTEAVASEGPRAAPERTEEVKVDITPPLSEEEEEGWSIHSDEYPHHWGYPPPSKDEYQKRLDEFEAVNKPFTPLETNRAIYLCSGCHRSGHTMANKNRPCLNIAPLPQED